jgi:hypothetical protein
MKEVTRKQIHDCFVTAKKHLWNGRTSRAGPGIYKERYICWAIDCDDGPAADRRNSPAKKIIMDRLVGHNTICNWLRYRARVPEELLTPKNVQAFRHRWLDSLIVEFSK